MIIFPRRDFFLCAVAIVAVFPSSGYSAPGSKVDFARDVLPVLSNKCFACHGPDTKKKSQLRLDSSAAATADRDGVRAIDPDNLANSEILIRLHDKEDPMPPEDAEKQLTVKEREILSAWVRQGGKYAEHWAFVPPKKQAGKKDIDSFIASQLEEEGVEFSPEADRATLARRVALILTGLPPEPQRLSKFLADSGPEAYSSLVEDLLASPRYGEHQARYWLDAVRYGDTHGLHLDNRRGIYPYRDWVVKAFNDNLPLDDFITWQLAGDLLKNPTLEQRVATGFVRMNPSTAEGGAIPDEFQAKNTFDRTETLGTVMLGMTLTCARCHTHKYDPIKQVEYYRLYAFFNNTAEGSMDGNRYEYAPVMKAPADGTQWRKWHELESERDKIIAEAEAGLKKNQLADTDGDGIFDIVEEGIAGDLDELTAGDDDGDGLDSPDEINTHGTNPLAADSDGDNLNDGREIAAGTNPNRADSDGDGINDDVEIANGTNPNKSDSDDDGWDDLVELAFGSDANDAASVPSTGDDLSLLGYWDFDDTTDPAVAVDQSPFGLDGAIINGAAYSADGEGHSGTAGDYSMNFGAAGAQSVQVTTDVYRVAGAQDAIAFSFWQKNNNIGTNTSSFLLYSPSVGINRAMHGHVPYSNGHIYFDGPGCCGAGTRISGPAGIVAGEWSHFVFQKNGPDKQVWKDGALLLEGGGQLPLPTDIGQMWIGSDKGVNSVHGYIDEFAIFDRALTGEQIAQLATGTPAIDLVVPPVDLKILEIAGQGTADQLTSLAITFASNDGVAYAAIEQWQKSGGKDRLKMIADPNGFWKQGALPKRATDLMALFAEAEKKFTSTLVAQERSKPRVTKMLTRGEYNLPFGDALTPGVPGILNNFPEAAPRNRLGLAQWMTARDQPLVSRVLVNRVWQRVFGHGLVRTPEDFGVQGEQPTHPELLDWLAVELQDSEWNLKHVLRLMVHSRTFKQDSRWRGDLNDPENRLFARGQSYRMDAEMLRDVALWASGLLIPTQGGEGAKPYQPKGMWAALMHPGSNTKNYVADKGDRLYRRSIYTYWKRTSPHPMMTLFDAPDRESSCVKRSRSNTALQSLGLLNETQRIEMSRKLAERLLHLKVDDDKRVDYLFGLLACRKPTDAERKACMGLLQKMARRYGGSEEDAIALLSSGEASRDEAHPPGKLAVWTQLTATVLASDIAILVY